MKNFKLFITLILVLALTLSACGKTDDAATTADTKEDTASTDTATEETEAPVVDEEAAEASTLEGDLVYWSMWNSTEPQAIALAEGIDFFMQMHPNVNIEVQWNGRDIRQTLQPALDNGEKKLTYGMKTLSVFTFYGGVTIQCHLKVI